MQLRTSLALSVFGTVVARVLGDARFVKVELFGSDKMLHMAQVRVFAVVDGVETNVALASRGATATQSSRFDCYIDATGPARCMEITSNGFAEHAIDGITPHPIMQTKWETNPWWMVDMQSSYRVTKIVVVNRLDADVAKNRLSGAKVSLLDADSNVEKELSIGDATNLDSFTFTIGHDTRFVKVSIKNDYLALAEVQVFAPADGADGVETNVALASGGATATQITTRNCASGSSTCPYRATNAIDGVTVLSNSNGITHTDNEADPWWMVDLKGSFPVRKIVLWNRQDMVMERLNNATVSLLDASGNVNRELHVGLTDGIVSFTFELGPPVYEWHLSYTSPSGDAVLHPAWYLEPRFQGKYGV